VGGDIKEGSASGPGLRGPRSVAGQAVGRALCSLAHGAGPVNEWVPVLGLFEDEFVAWFCSSWNICFLYHFRCAAIWCRPLYVLIKIAFYFCNFGRNIIVEYC